MIGVASLRAYFEAPPGSSPTEQHNFHYAFRESALNVVMNATAGTRGRFELMSRRWSIMGFATAVSLAVVGNVLGRIGFPLNYQLVFFGFSLTGLWAYTYGSKIQVPDHPPAARGAAG